MLLWWWAPARRAVNDAVLPLTRLVWVAAPRARPAAPPAPPARPAPPRAPASAVRPSPLAATPVATPQPPVADVAQAIPAPADARAAAPGAAELLARAKAQAGAIDRDLREGKNKALALAPGGWSSLGDKLEAAHKERGNGAAMDTYADADGVVYYRHRVGGRVLCRKGGSVGPPANWRSEGAVLAGAGSWGDSVNAGFVACPGGANWKRQ